MKIHCGKAVFGMLTAFTLCALTGAQADVTLDAAIQARSVVDPGDTARLQNVLARARRGEKITVGVIGGSITEGAKATSAENRYGDRIARWWREQFPQAQIVYVNAGIGATGSNYGALRIKEHLLKQQPDFVVAEYAVNDGNDQNYAETLEGMVRQILTLPNKPAVMLLFMMHNNGGNAQEWHSKVGKHYNLPMVSYRDAMWPEIQAGHLKWEDVMADEVHPNNRGHEVAATLVTSFLAKTLRQLPKDTALPRIAKLPKPLFSDRFEHTALLDAGTIAPVKNEGWTLQDFRNGKCWFSNQPGSVLEFEVNGDQLLLMYWRIKGAMGRAQVQVDDNPAQTLEAWFGQTWGGYRVTDKIGDKLTPGKHRVRITLLAEKNAESTGNEFRLLGLGAAGVQ